MGDEKKSIIFNKFYVGTPTTRMYCVVQRYKIKGTFGRNSILFTTIQVYSLLKIYRSEKKLEIKFAFFYF